MKFELTEDIDVPVHDVSILLRDRLLDLVPYLPSVNGIHELERAIEGSDVLVVNLWEGSRAMMPVVARPFVTKAMVTWKDHARWTATHQIHWRLEPHALASLFSCEGVNYLEARPDGSTRFRITGDLEVYPERIPGISDRMAKKLAPKLAPWIIERVRPNLSQVPVALRAFFADGNRPSA